MGLKALRKATEDAAPELSAKFEAQFEASREYSRNVGNLYTGSLYLSLLSLLQNSEDLVAGQRIGLFSYGSGAQGEFFSGILQPGFKALAADKTISEMLLQRKQVSVKEYEKIYRSSLEIADNVLIDHDDDPASFVLTGVKDAQRKYAYKLAQ